MFALRASSKSGCNGCSFQRKESNVFQAEAEVHCLVRVEAEKSLGAWCGLVKLDDDGVKSSRLKATSCVVVTNFGAETQAISVLLDFSQKQSNAAWSKQHACLFAD